MATQAIRLRQPRSVLPHAKTAEESSEETSGIVAFVNAVAGTIHTGAWPTATFKKASLKGVERVQGGYDVFVQLSGTSAFDDGDLWLKLVIMLRNGKRHDIKIGDHNAILAEPFSTLKSMAAFVEELSRESATTSSPNAGSVCIMNRTDIAVRFRTRWKGQNGSRSVSNPAPG